MANGKIHLYSQAEADGVRIAAQASADVLARLCEAVTPGMSTADLDMLAESFIRDTGGKSAFLGYRGYPKSCCTSLNEVVCHGIPDDTVLREGDLINVDITAYREGMHGDLNRTFIVGDADQDTVDLVTRTEAALHRGIKVVAPGRQINLIGRAIESYAKRFGYGVIREFTGHGVGRAFHTGLIVPHYDAAPLHDEEIVPGMVFTIEPMLTMGTPESPGTIAWDEWDDDWTIVMRDRRRTAQFEHTIVVTESGAEILTLP